MRRHDRVAADQRVTERQRVIDALAIDRQICRATDAQIVPWRFRVPLIDEIEAEHALHEGRFQHQAGSTFQLLGKFAAYRIDNIHFSVLQRRQPRGFVGDDPQYQPFDGGSFAPISVKGLEHQFETGLERYELVWPGPDRRLPESFLADLLDMIFRDDPAGPRCRG